MRQKFISMLSLLMVVVLLPWDSALALSQALDVSGDTQFKNGEQAYMLKVCGMDGEAEAYVEGTALTASTNANTVQNWAETLQDNRTAALRFICNETQDNCAELRELPVSDSVSLFAISQVESAVNGYIQQLEPINSWLEWAVDLLDYDRQRVDYLIRRYNEGGLSNPEKAEIVRTCRNLTAEVVSTVAEIAAKQRTTEASIGSLEQTIHATLCGDINDASPLGASALALATANDHVESLVAQMDSRAAQSLALAETTQLKSQGMDFEVEVLASDEWALIVSDAQGNKPLTGVKVVVTSVEDPKISKEITTDAKGMIILKYTDFKPKDNYAMLNIELTKQGYRTFAAEYVTAFGGSGVRLNMTPDDGKPYIISATFDKYELMQTVNTYYVTSANDIDHTITLRVNTKGKSLKVQYYLDYFNKIAESSEVQGDDVKVTLKGKFLNGDAIPGGTKHTRFYLYQGFKNYETYEVPAAFVKSSVTKPKIEKTNAIQFLPGSALSIPQDLLRMGKLDFSLDLGLPEVSIMADVGGRFYLAIGDKLQKFKGDEYTWKSRSKKEQDDKIKSLGKDGAIAKINAQKQIMKEGYSSKKTKFLGEGSIDVSFFGMGSGEVHNGHVSLDGGGAISFSAKIDFTWQFFIPTPFFTIPAFFALDFGVGAMLYEDFGVQFDFPSFSNFSISSATGFTLRINISVGATLGVGFAKMVNIYGRISGAATLSMFISKSGKTDPSFTLGWGFEVGVQIFLFKLAWRNGPFEKTFKPKERLSSSDLDSYALTMLLSESGEDSESITYPLFDSANSVEEAIAYYPELNHFMAGMSSWTEAANTTLLSGEGVKPTKRTEVLSDISLVGQEIKYLDYGGSTYAFWITPNVDSGGKTGVPKLVWLNLREPRYFGRVDINFDSKGEYFNIDFDLVVGKRQGKDVINLVITAAPISGYNEETKRFVYDTSNSHVWWVEMVKTDFRLTVSHFADIQDEPKDDLPSPRNMIKQGWMYVSPSITTVVKDDKTYLYFNFSMEKVNEKQLSNLHFFSLMTAFPTNSNENPKLEGLYHSQDGNSGWYQDSLYILSYPDRENSTQLNTVFSHLSGPRKNLLNITGIQPVYDDQGRATGALYLQRSSGGTTKLFGIYLTRDSDKKLVFSINDYDIVVEADHFKISPTMKSGSYYVYWVEQSKGAKVNGVMHTEPKYTIKCCVYDATEKLFSPMFTLLQTDSELATADFRVENGKLIAFCLEPNQDWGQFGKLAYVRGKLVKYNFDLKGMTDLVGVGADEPVLEAGMDNKILVKVNNPGNLPVTKFGLSAYSYQVDGSKKLMKSFLIDTTTQENSQVTEYTYAEDGSMTFTTTNNSLHQIYEVPAVGDESDTKFINPIFTEYDESGNPISSSAKPSYLKLLMPGYTRTYKFSLPIPKEWAGKNGRKRAKIYVELTNVFTVSPEDSFLPVGRNASGELVTASGAVIPEYALGIDPTANGTAVNEVTTPGGLTLTWGKVQDTDANGVSVLTSTPIEQLTVPYNDLWIDVTRHMVNGVEYATVNIGNKASDDAVPSEPPTLVVTTDGVETFRYTFAKSIERSYSYTLDAPIYRFSKTLRYEDLVFTVVNSDAYNELDDYDNSCKITSLIAAQPSPSPEPVVPPMTGDTSNPALWISLTGLAVLALALLLLKRR